MEIISRKEAREKGLTRFYTGVPCKYSHDCERRVVNNICVECEAIAKKKCAEKYPEKNKRACKDWYERNRNYQLKKQRQHRCDNLELYKEKDRNYYKNNREEILVRAKKHYENNKDRYAAQAAKYRAMKKKATPAWFSNEKKDIETIYEIASYWSDILEKEYHVDHIYPIHSDYVCGLHCLDNLQIITAFENHSKSNKFEVT